MTKSTTVNLSFVAQTEVSEDNWVDLPSTRSSYHPTTRNLLDTARKPGRRHRILQQRAETTTDTDIVWEEARLDVEVTPGSYVPVALRNILPARGFRFAVAVLTGTRLSLVATFAQESYARDYARSLVDDRARAGIAIFVCDRELKGSPILETRST